MTNNQLLISVLIFLNAMGSSAATIILIMLQYPVWISLYFLFITGISWVCFYKLLSLYQLQFGEI